VGASQRTETLFDGHAKNVHNPRQANPFELHVLFLSIAISSWRPYLVYLIEQVTELVFNPRQMLDIVLIAA
jgi:hypothetical protein